MPSISIHVMTQDYAICRLPAADSLPAWARGEQFSSVTRTPDELSILCPAAAIPAEISREDGWRLLRFKGPFAFTETGVLASVLDPLAKARIGILAISTFDTDYVLVKSVDLDKACAVLADAGHEVSVQEP